MCLQYVSPVELHIAFVSDDCFFLYGLCFSVLGVFERYASLLKNVHLHHLLLFSVWRQHNRTGACKFECAPLISTAKKSSGFRGLSTTE